VPPATRALAQLRIGIMEVSRNALASGLGAYRYAPQPAASAVRLTPHPKIKL